MLKKISLSILSALIITNTALASEAQNVKIVSVEESPISRADVSAISMKWSKGNMAAYQYMMSAFNIDAAQDIIDHVPAMKENKTALICLTMGLMMMMDQGALDNLGEALLNLSTQPELAQKAEFSLSDVANAYKSRGL